MDTLMEYTVTATDARNNIGRLWENARRGPVKVLSAGKPVAVVVSPDDYEALKRAAERGARPVPRPGFAADLFPGVDVDALLAVPIEDQFEGYL
ncbi:MAG: type II toxin-antitoxin system Phd/YefM family antitoxin [Armatimonadetes bacterium]|nr:type II toxin-antitoxin system Phd/YefM family antitoxin [Armatimonadota bacterium]